MTTLQPPTIRHAVRPVNRSRRSAEIARPGIPVAGATARSAEPARSGPFARRLRVALFDLGLDDLGAAGLALTADSLPGPCGLDDLDELLRKLEDLVSRLPGTPGNQIPDPDQLTLF